MGEGCEGNLLRTFLLIAFRFPIICPHRLCFLKLVFFCVLSFYYAGVGSFILLPPEFLIKIQWNIDKEGCKFTFYSLVCEKYFFSFFFFFFSISFSLFYVWIFIVVVVVRSHCVSPISYPHGGAVDAIVFILCLFIFTLLYVYANIFAGREQLFGSAWLCSSRIQVNCNMRGRGMGWDIPQYIYCIRPRPWW